MKILVFLTTLSLTLSVWAQANVEIQASYIKDNKNYIYMKTKAEKLKIKKSELTKEGVKQILANKDKTLTLFVPESSIVNRSALPEAQDE